MSFTPNPIPAGNGSGSDNPFFVGWHDDADELGIDLHAVHADVYRVFVFGQSKTVACGAELFHQALVHHAEHGIEPVPVGHMVAEVFFLSRVKVGYAVEIYGTKLHAEPEVHFFGQPIHQMEDGSLPLTPALS